MKRYKILLVNILWLNYIFIYVFPQDGSYKDLVVSDGPYIFSKDGSFKIWSVKNNHFEEDILTSDNFGQYRNRFGLLFDFKDLTGIDLQKPVSRQVYRRVDSIGVISDIHGNFNKYINLLRSAGIIDKANNWIFGKGHLVVLGDIFDRGDNVTEILWHLYGLEKQAYKAGGMVHVLLGNHEMMIFDKDLRYISDKYRKVEEVTGSSYSEFYSTNSVLGLWLRSKPIIITINNILLLHAGISTDLSKRYSEVSAINQIIRNALAGKDVRSDSDTTGLNYLTHDKGPFWYRGYFTDQNFDEESIDSILYYYNRRHVIVGHTPSEHIRSFYGNKLIGVDSGIGNGEPGEMLLIKDGYFYVVNKTGKRSRIIDTR
jgi:hypothetical protein